MADDAYFEAARLPRADIKDPAPEEPQHPGSFTSRLRKRLLTDPFEILRAEQQQTEYQRKLGDTPVPPE